MLELRGQRTVRRYTRPVVRPGLVLVGTDIDHRFNSKAHSWLGRTNGLVFCVVWDVWRTVE